MADLKSGTTVGGNTIWTQGNLTLTPAGDTLTYRGYKVYTENDKPTKFDIGLENVTNDEQVKKAGDTMTGGLKIAKDLEVAERMMIVQKTDGVAPYFLASRSDTKAGVWPSVVTEQFSSLVKTAPVAGGDPKDGGLMFSHRVEQNTNGSTTARFTVYQPALNLGSRIGDGDVAVELILDGITRQVKTTNGLVVGSLISNGIQNTGTMSVIGDASFSSKLAVTGRNSGIELGSIRETGLAYVDFHTSGTDTDFDYRLYASATGFVFDQASTVNTDIDMTKTRFLRLSSTDASGIQTRFGAMLIRDYANGNTSISAGRKAADDNTGGTLILGYHNPSLGSYTNAVRLSTTLVWTGGNTLVDTNGKITTSSFDVPMLPLTGGSLKGNLAIDGSVNTTSVVEARPATDPNFVTGNFYNTPELRTMWRTRGANTTGGTPGYVSLYGQEQVGTAFRACLSVIGYNSSPTWQFEQTGTFISPGAVISSHANGLRIRQPGSSVFQRYDSTWWYFMLADSETGDWNSLRPMQIQKSNGNVQFGHQVSVGGGLAVGVGSNAWGAGIAIGDTDSGIRTGGDGVIQVWANNQRIAHFDGGQAFFDKRIQGPAGASITDINVYNGDLNQSNDAYSTYCRDLYVRSDIRVKKGLTLFSNPSETLSKMNGYLYLQKKGENDDGSERWVQSAGLIAQEVQAQLPELITADKETGLLRLNYNGVIALNTATINQHTQEIAAYKDKVDSLTDLVEKMAKRLEELETK